MQEAEIRACPYTSESVRKLTGDLLKIFVQDCLLLVKLEALDSSRTHLSMIECLLLQRLCSSLPDDPSAIGQLDPDTALSRGTWRAAMAGVGACCHAIDSIMAGKVLKCFSHPCCITATCSLPGLNGPLFLLEASRKGFMLSRAE